jgi:hypothetical protein
VWLQEMMRFRNRNRDGGTLRSWFQRWLREHDTLDPDLAFDQMLHALVHEAAGAERVMQLIKIGCKSRRSISCI